MSGTDQTIIGIEAPDHAVAPQSLGARFRSRFRRRTSSGRFIAEIDGLRFPAIAVVVFGHLSAYFIGRPQAPALTGWGDWFCRVLSNHAGEGVVLFFIISGFVLALPFASASLAGTPPVKLGDYYLRRLTRLEPPYLISLVGLLLLKIVARRFHLVAGQETDAVLLRHFAVSAAYLHNVVYGVPSIINGVAWSLEIEIQFYLLVPLLTQVFRLRSTFARRATILVAIVGAIAIQQAWIVDEGRLYLSILNFAQYFLFGFLLADLYLTERIGAAEKHWAWDVASALSWIAVFGFWPAQVLSPVVVPFVAFVAFVSVFRGPLTNAVFTNAWITTIGGMCYSIYLLHFALIATFGKVLLGKVPSTGAVWRDLLVQGPLLLVLALAGSTIFFYAIELPCMDKSWPRRLFTGAKALLRSATAA